jgi:hypothetical protein
MTNSEAFQIYYPDADRATFVLTSKGIDSALADENDVSGAYGMIESVTSANYSQGRTSESLSAGARTQLLNNAKQILNANGIYLSNGSATVGSTKW